MRPTLNRLSPVLLLLAALLLAALPAPGDTPAPQPSAPKVFVPTAPAPPPVFTPAGKAASVAAGTAGAKGDPGPAGLQGLPGLPGPPGLSAIPVVTVQASQYGAVGDGVHNDTAAIQSAINYALSASDRNIAATHQRYAVVIPPGVYNVNLSLLIERLGGLYAGITIQGSGTSPQGLPLEGGTTIRMVGAAQDSVVKIGQGQFRDICIRDLTLQMASDTANGLHIATTQASRYRFENIVVNAPPGCHGAAVRQDELSTLGNGESPIFINVNAYNVDRMFDFRSGQAFGAILIGCGGIKNNGGISLSFGAGTGSAGYQATILGWSGSSAIGPLPNTFLYLGSSISGNIVVIGAREEEEDTVLSLAGSGATTCGMVSIQDSHLDGMTDHGLAIDGGGNSSQWQIDLVRDKFSCVDSSRVFAVRTYQGHTGAQGDNSRYNWQQCEFETWGSVNLGYKPVVASPADPRHSGYDGTIVTDCWRVTPGDPTQPYKVAVTN